MNNIVLFTWDANGNMTEHRNHPNFGMCRLCWDEENRLSGIVDDYAAGVYFYDASGERTLKITGNHQWMNTNGTPRRFVTLDNPILYASEYLVASRKGYTKHYYIEGQRIASKIGTGGITTIDSVQNANIMPKALNLVEKMLNVTISCLNVTWCNFVYSNYNGKTGLLPELYQYKNLGAQENEVYFYHPDHLGSTNWITDAVGRHYQYFQYLPFGETFVERRNGLWTTPYKFNGKPLDEETGYYNYGARMYDPTLSSWLSVDPDAYKYPHLTPYNYCANNPVVLIDPDGRGPGDRVAAARHLIGTKYFQEKEKNELWKRTRMNAAGLEFMDCSELVCRVLASDEITNKIRHMNTAGLLTFLGNKNVFDNDMIPQVGDIVLWRGKEGGHTGIVSQVNEDGEVKLIHAAGIRRGVVEDEKFEKLGNREGQTFHGYYRPKNETLDGKVTPNCIILPLRLNVSAYRNSDYIHQNRNNHNNKSAGYGNSRSIYRTSE